MANVIIDNFVVLFAVIYYAFLCLIYIIRAFDKKKTETALAPVFSVQLAPFALLCVMNFVVGADILHLVTLLPIILYLVYDLWYRLLTKKKSVHHPKRWPAGLVIYLVLLQVGSIALNWYGFLVSQMHGRVLIACYFIMLGCFGFYQSRHSRRIAAETSRPESVLN